MATVQKWETIEKGGGAAASGKRVQIVMDRFGDTRHKFDAADAHAVALAEERLPFLCRINRPPPRRLFQSPPFCQLWEKPLFALGSHTWSAAAATALASFGAARHDDIAGRQNHRITCGSRLDLADGHHLVDIQQREAARYGIRLKGRGSGRREINDLTFRDHDRGISYRRCEIHHTRRLSRRAVGPVSCEHDEGRR
jgi:hypothetical protein